MVNFVSLGASSLDFFIYCFTQTTDWATYHGVKQDVLLKVMEIIERHHAEVAFPTRSVLLAPAEPEPRGRVSVLSQRKREELLALVRSNAKASGEGSMPKVAATVDAEMARFQREKLADFKQIVVQFVSTQLECSQRIQATWQGLLPQLEAIEPPPPPPPGPPPPLEQ